MDEMNEEQGSASEDVIEECGEEVEEGEPRRPHGRGLFAGLLSGAIVGGVLALLLAPLRGEKGMPAGGWQAERAQTAVDAILAGLKGAWSALRARLRDAAEETKEGMAEGRAQARDRFETMTKRRGRKR